MLNHQPLANAGARRGQARKAAGNAEANRGIGFPRLYKLLLLILTRERDRAARHSRRRCPLSALSLVRLRYRRAMMAAERPGRGQEPPSANGQWIEPPRCPVHRGRNAHARSYWIWPAPDVLGCLTRARGRTSERSGEDVVLSFIYAGAPYLRQTTKFNPGIRVRTTAVDSYSAPRSHYGLRETGLDEDDAAVGQSENAADNDSLKMEARFQRVEATRANSPSDLPKFGDRFVT
jgi:hypothetical protein